MHRLKQLLLGVISVVLAGCAALQPPTEYTGLPEQLPVRAQVFYEPYLDCLCDLLNAKGASEVDVLIGGLGDVTRPPNALEGGHIGHINGPFMAQTGLARLAPRISVITPEAFHPARKTLLVKGGFTELDRTIASSGVGGGARVDLIIARLDLAINKDRTFDILTLDIALALPDGRQLPGLAIALSVLVDSKTGDAYLLAEHSTGKVAASAAGQIKSVSRRHAAQRLLIYAGLYWLFSQYFAIDGQVCVDAPQTDVEAVRELVRAYQKMPQQKRVSAIQQLLQAQGVPLEGDGLLGLQTRRAIRQFQARIGDPPTGEISAYLYVQLHKRAQMQSKGDPHAAQQEVKISQEAACHAGQHVQNGALCNKKVRTMDRLRSFDHTDAPHADESTVE